MNECKIRKTQGGRRTAEYSRWCQMLLRCHDSKNSRYADYGGRGIRVCRRWRDPRTGFFQFCADMGPCPQGHSLERKNNDHGYSPDNCVWATPSEQNRNRRNTVWISYRGQTLPASSWSEKLGIPLETIRCRMRAGYPVEQVLRQGLLQPVKASPDEKARKIAARQAVNNAVHRGKLTRPRRCQNRRCRAAGPVQAHHHNGYDDPFDVLWLCKACHRKYEVAKCILVK